MPVQFLSDAPRDRLSPAQFVRFRRKYDPAPLVAVRVAARSRHLMILQFGNAFLSSLDPAFVTFVPFTLRMARLLRAASSVNPSSVTFVFPRLRVARFENTASSFKPLSVTLVSFK